MMRRSMPLPMLVVAAVLGAFPLVGAARPAGAAQDGQAKAPKKAPCAVCSVREGAGAEPVRASTTYEGKTYYFCQEACRDEFLKDPKAFLHADMPRPAPNFSLKDLEGRTLELGGYKGKVVLVDFWATWCAPCVASMPKLQRLHRKFEPKGFAVVGIAIDEKGVEVVAPMARRKKVTYPILLGNEATWTAYGVKSLPALFLVDRQGQIVKQFGAATSHGIIEKEVQRLVEQ